MAELIANGTAAAVSADFVLAAGESATLFLKGPLGVVPGFSVVDVQAKAADGTYTTIGVLDSSVPAKVLGSPGTFRVSRGLSSKAVGVERG